MESEDEDVRFKCAVQSAKDWEELLLLRGKELVASQISCTSLRVRLVVVTVVVARVVR